MPAGEPIVGLSIHKDDAIRLQHGVCNPVSCNHGILNASIVASQCFCFCCRLCLYLVCLRMWHICHSSFKLGSPGHEIYACVMSMLQCWRTCLGLESSRRTMPLSCEHLCAACSCRPSERRKRLCMRVCQPLHRNVCIRHITYVHMDQQS